ncbi:MAG: hypothetical protein Q7S28_02360 [bacterium]|nr:hypothetical protein [bacterium]
MKLFRVARTVDVVGDGRLEIDYEVKDVVAVYADDEDEAKAKALKGAHSIDKVERVGGVMTMNEFLEAFGVRIIK